MENKWTSFCLWLFSYIRIRLVLFYFCKTWFWDLHHCSRTKPTCFKPNPAKRQCRNVTPDDVQQANASDIQKKKRIYTKMVQVSFALHSRLTTVSLWILQMKLSDTSWRDCPSAKKHQWKTHGAKKRITNDSGWWEFSIFYWKNVTEVTWMLWWKMSFVLRLDSNFEPSFTWIILKRSTQRILRNL